MTQFTLPYKRQLLDIAFSRITCGVFLIALGNNLMKRINVKSLLLGAAFLFSFSSAQANLILNGGFEDSVVGNGNWKWFQSSDVNGWNGSNIEVWNNYGSVTAYEGKQHAELNAHPGNGSEFSIYQTFTTDIGSSYDLSFAYRARANSNEAFRVELVGTSALIDQLIQDHIVGSWSSYANSFVANSAQTTLRFTTVTPKSHTVGNFLDAISVNTSKVHTVPELSASLAPVSLALLAGLMLMGFERRRKQV